MNQKKAKAIRDYLMPARAALKKKEYRRLYKMTKKMSKGVPIKDYKL